MKDDPGDDDSLAARILRAWLKSEDAFQRRFVIPGFSLLAILGATLLRLLFGRGATSEDVQEAARKKIVERLRRDPAFRRNAKLALEGLPEAPVITPLPSKAPIYDGAEVSKPQIVCIASNKGGSGKTTIAQCLAVEALRQGLPSAIIDTDPQHSALRWGEHRTSLQIDAPTVVASGARSIKELTGDLLGRGAQFIVIDTPPHSLPAINAALEMATGTVMVTRPNPMDLAALETTWSIVSKIKKPSSTVLTQTPPGDRARALKLAQERLDELGISYCPTPMTYTLSYPYAQAGAVTIQEREPTSKARAEVAEIWSWCKRQGVF